MRGENLSGLDLDALKAVLCGINNVYLEQTFGESGITVDIAVFANENRGSIVESSAASRRSGTTSVTYEPKMIGLNNRGNFMRFHMIL